MEVEKTISPPEEKTEPIVFLRIDIVFKDSSGDLDRNAHASIETPGSIYFISIDPPTRQLQISGIFECQTYRKTVTAFSEVPHDAAICLDTELNPKLKIFFDRFYHHGVSEVERLFKLLRWKYRLGFGELKYHSENIYWSIDKLDWNNVTRCPSVENLQARFLDEMPLDTEMIKELMETGKEEPIFFELLREANSISHTNLKSAFVIAVSALEVAVKYLIKNHAPITEWLVSEMPSPSLEKIINEFFPKLIHNFSFPESQNKLLKSAVSVRNKLVHSGNINNKRKDLFKMMNFINEFILQTINPNLR